MSTTALIIISIFSFFFILNLCIMLQGREQNGQGLRKGLAQDLFFLVVATIFFPGVIYVLATEAYYRNRPRPMPRKTRKYLRKDLVSADGRTMSLAEYNATHKRQFTLEQVYGKKYVRSITEEEREKFDSFDNSVVTPEEGTLPDGLAADIAILFQECLSSGSFTELEPCLAEDVRLVLYGSRTIKGRDAVSFYWSDYVVRSVRDNVPFTSEVCTCGYDGSVAIRVRPRGYIQMYVMFRIEDGLVRTMLFTPVQLQPAAVRYHDLDHEKYSRETVDANKGERIKDRFENRMPCMSCGESSENLEWYEFDICHGPYGHKGRISVCPHCGEMVEFYPDVFYRCDA